MESDDEFISPGQRYRFTNRPAVSSSSQQAPSQPNASRQRVGPAGASQSAAQAMSQLRDKMRALTEQVQQMGGDSQPSTSSQPTARMISELNDGVTFMMERVSQLSQDSRGIKRPAVQRPVDKKPDIKEQCLICKKYYANKNNLFKHYRAQHVIMNPEVYHGCTVDNNIVSLDDSTAAASQSVLDNRVITVSNKENVNTAHVINKMYKCDECGGYFEERKKLDDHMKAQHGYEFTCQTCHKHLLYKDVDGHVKDNHPDVYKKREEERVKKIIIEKVKVRNGNRVRVIICTECNIEMIDKNQAERHARAHKKGKIKAVRKTVSRAKHNDTNVPTNNDVILTCTQCDISTGSYDVAVDHSQKHLTTPDVQFIGQTCGICKLKFEPLCYQKHIDLHYNNKELHKKSFKYYAYRFQLLLTKNWLDSFDMNEPAMKNMEADSIYKHTRSVKMRVTPKGVHKLYKCCQCNTHVEPAAVLTHTLNYDTCLTIKSSFACEICLRKFHNPRARNNHRNQHKSEDSYTIVLFNHENDKEMNEILNSPRLINNESRNEAAAVGVPRPGFQGGPGGSGTILRLVPDTSGVGGPRPCPANSLNAPTAAVANDGIENANGNPKKVYKCQSCSLCFLQKENADMHAKICPGKDVRKSCPKCNNCFNTDELVAHCFEHHVNETEIVIESFTPEVIVIESDDEDIIEINSSYEDDVPERLSNIILEVLKVEHVATAGGSNESQINALGAAITNAAVESTGQINSGALDKENNEQENMDDDGEAVDNEFGGCDNDVTDGDSQDTISYVNPENGTDVARSTFDNTRDELKLVPINLLLNPLHFANEYLSRNIKTELTNDIENVRRQIETTAIESNSVHLNDTVIKQEKSWLFDPTNFSYIGKRPSLRRKLQPTSSNLSEDVIESLLTDDEEPEVNPDNEEPVNDMRDDPSNSNSQVERTLNENTVVETWNEISRVSNHESTPIIQNETVNDIEPPDGRNPDYEDSVQAELINNDCQRAVNNITPPNLLADNENNRLNYSDDLFVQSGVENRIQSHTSINDNENRNSENDVLPEVSDHGKGLSDKNADNITREEAESVHVENTPSENNDRFVGNNDNADNINDTVDTENDYRSAENTLSNHGEHTIEESNPNKAHTGNFNNAITPEIVPREKPIKEITTDNARNIQKVLDVNIKKELIAENDDSSADTVEIKTEPTGDDEYGNKENAPIVMNNKDNCNIV